MGITALVGKIVLGIINAVFLLIALIFFGLGILIIAKVDILVDYADTLEKELVSATETAGVSGLDTSEFTTQELLLPIAYGLVVIAIVMGVIAVIGLVAICCGIKILFTVYTIVITVLFVVQLVMVIVIYADKSTFDGTIKPYLKDTLDDYEGLEGTDKTSLIWNAIMKYEECCGVDSYEDFEDLDKWPKATVNGQTLTNQKTPVMCCKTLVANDYTCAEAATATDANNNQNIGCYDDIYERFTESPYFISALVVIFLFQVACIVVSFWILCTWDNIII